MAEPALMLGIAAVALARPTDRRRLRILDLMLLVAWVAAAITIPIALAG